MPSASSQDEIRKRAMDVLSHAPQQEEITELIGLTIRTYDQIQRENAKKAVRPAIEKHLDAHMRRRDLFSKLPTVALIFTWAFVLLVGSVLLYITACSSLLPESSCKETSKQLVNVLQGTFLPVLTLVLGYFFGSRGSAMADPKTPKSNAEAQGRFAETLKELRISATKHLQTIDQIQKGYAEDSAKTLFSFLSAGGIFKHTQGIWFSSEEFVTELARAIFKTAWGKHLDASKAIEELSSLSTTLYWRPTKELALLMYASSGRSAGDLWEYIDYAKRHLLYQSLTVIDTTNSLSQAIQDLTDFYERFSAREYFSDLQSRAFQVYEKRRRQGATYDDELGDWLRAERERLEEPARTNVEGIRDSRLNIAGDQHAARAIGGATIPLTLTINRDYATYTVDHADKLMDMLSKMLQMSERPRILNIEEGSVKITIEIPIEHAYQLAALQRSGRLRALDIESVDVIGAAAAAAIVKEKRRDGNYDVFMCHNADDKGEVKRIGVKLISEGLLPWLDEWEMRPGRAWQKELENQIGNIKAAAVFVGQSGIGPWQNVEVDSFVRQFVQRECPIIPAILRSCKTEPVIPPFLNGMTWVDFRKRSPDPYERLIWGITGEKSKWLWMR